MADDHDLFLADLREAADERVVVAEAAVAAHLHEVGGEELEVVERVRPLRMPHDLDALPWREVGVELVALLIELSLELLQLRLGVGDVLLELDFRASIFFSSSTSGFSNSNGVGFIGNGKSCLRRGERSTPFGRALPSLRRTARIGRPMYICPCCNQALLQVSGQNGIAWECQICGGEGMGPDRYARPSVKTRWRGSGQRIMPRTSRTAWPAPFAASRCTRSMSTCPRVL